MKCKGSSFRKCSSFLFKIGAASAYTRRQLVRMDVDTFLIAIDIVRGDESNRKYEVGT
jgi:hypothetical protein